MSDRSKYSAVASSAALKAGSFKTFLLSLSDDATPKRAKDELELSNFRVCKHDHDSHDHILISELFSAPKRIDTQIIP